MLRIDSHHHLWDYNRQEYGWITAEMSALRRNFTPDDLKAELDANQIDYCVAVQARQTLNETRFLLNAARDHVFIKGVVGWLPLTDEDLDLDLEHFSKDAKLRAVRHVLQDESDDNYMLRDDFNRGIRALRAYDLAYDILIFERHLPQTIEFVDKHPGQRFIVDHLAKPRVRDGEISAWREWIVELAKRPHVYCKLSGLATEAGPTAWTESQLHEYLDVVLNAFGSRRVLFGSDWPVCLLAIPYGNWVAIVNAALAKLSGSEQARIWSGTAVEAYKLLV
jgi:L-fuconolactonase